MALFSTITIASGGKTYSFSGIEVNDEEDLKVKREGTFTNLSTPGDYTITGGQITFSAGFSVTNGEKYTIYRDTKDDAARNQFYPSGSVRAQDLNKNFEQVLFAAEDKLPQVGAVLPDNIDMGGHKITNLENEYTGKTLGDANDNDAVTAGWVKSFFFDTGAETIENTETWISDNLKVATTNAIDNRIDAKVDTAVVNDITFSSEFTKANDTPATGQIQVSLTDNQIDVSKLKAADLVDKSEQTADNTTQNAGNASAFVDDDEKLATMAAIIKRHDNIVQNGTPAGTDYQKGMFWWDEAGDKTLSVWDGSTWAGIASGGTFINQPRLIWVDKENGNDSFDGHRVINPMKTIKAAVASANDGDMIFVQPGVYPETCPIDLGSKKNVSVVGLSQRSVFVHPTAATETENMWLAGSGTLLANMTWAGVKASGTRGDYALDTDSTHGLPGTQGWFVAFSQDDGDGNKVKFFKSPFIQNVTAFADSGIDNASFDPNLNASQPAFAGDKTSAMTGGGMLVDGNAPHTDSPLRSIVTEAYTFICLDGPGALVTNGGYAQLVSTFGTFCHYHAKALNGGMINMSNCVTDFGRFGLIADGKSGEIFTANTITGENAAAGQKVIKVQDSVGSFRGQSTPNPADHMIVEVTYDDASTELIPIEKFEIVSSVKTITVATNLTRQINADTTLKFYLRSIISTGGHVFEFAGSGTDYRAHPDNGGIPDEANQVKDLNDGKVYVTSSDHNGKFKVGPLEVSTDGNEVKYKGNALAASATTDTTDAANISSGTLPDARLSDTVTGTTAAFPTSLTVDNKGRITSITAGTPLSNLTYTVEQDGDNALLKVTDTANSVSDQVKIVAGTSQTIVVDSDSQFTLNSPNSTVANVNIATSAPSSPDNGEMWWDSDTGASYIYYNDGNTSQWVQFAPQQTGTGNGTVTSITAGTGLDGGAISVSGTIDLADTAVTAASYGSASEVPTFTVDAQGRLTAAADTNIAIAGTAITSGTISVDRIPQLTNAKMPSPISVSNIPSLAASKITSGTFTAARIPNLAGDGSATDTYLETLAADLSPQLGANLDVAGFDIVSVSNGDIDFQPNGTGKVVFKNGNGIDILNDNNNSVNIKLKPGVLAANWTLTLPGTDGSANEFLQTDGSGTTTWAAETTYDLSGADDGGDFRIRLAGTDSTNDDVKIKAGTGISLSNSSGETTIASTTAGVPTGTVQWFAGSSAPSGWLVCDGSSRSTSTFSDLFAVIGTTYGGGGSNFNLPDLRGEFIRGLDSGRGVDSGRGLGTSQGSANLQHNHGGQTGNHSHSYTRTFGGTHCLQPGGACLNIDSGSGGQSTGNARASISNDGGSESRPRNVALLPIIKT